MTQKRRCHAREVGHPDLAARVEALDSRFRGNDTTLKDLILNNAPDLGSASQRASKFASKIALVETFTSFACHWASPNNYRIDWTEMPLPSLRGALATKQSRGRVMRPLDCFAALAMTGGELARLFLGVA
jgi:hypothetical protein